MNPEFTIFETYFCLSINTGEKEYFDSIDTVIKYVESKKTITNLFVIYKQLTITQEIY